MLFALVSNVVTVVYRNICSLKQLLLIACLAAASVFATGCKSGYPVSARNNPGGPGEARQVQIARAAETPMERTITVTGTLAAFDQATVSAKVPGRVRSLQVDLGSIVHKGELIAQLEQQDYQLRLKQTEAALAQARARVGLSPDGADERVDPEQTSTVRQASAVLNEAKLNLDRANSLFKQGVIARAQLDAAEAGHKVAIGKYQDAVEEIRNRMALVVQRRSELEIARQQLTDTSIYAPFDGMIQERRTSMGEYLAAGTPVVTLVRIDPLRLRVEVPERESRGVHQSQTVRVTVEGDSNSYEGHIARISPTISAENRVLIVEAEVRNNGQLKPGSFARADIVTDSNSLTVTVPSSAIVTFAGIEKVIIVQDGKAVEKPVQSGRRNGELTEILSGLNVGDAVVINPGNLQSGQPVVVSQ